MSILFVFFLIGGPPRSTLFLYTTLFRSLPGKPYVGLDNYRAAFSDSTVHSSAKTSLIFVADRKSTRLNSSHRCISYAVFCLKKKNIGAITCDIASTLAGSAMSKLFGGRQ